MRYADLREINSACDMLASANATSFDANASMTRLVLSALIARDTLDRVSVLMDTNSAALGTRPKMAATAALNDMVMLLARVDSGLSPVMRSITEHEKCGESDTGEGFLLLYTEVCKYITPT